MRTIEVIAVIIRHEAKYLLTFKDKWRVYNVPSTKTREGETLEQAAQRVLLQDLGVNCDQFAPDLTLTRLKSFRLVQHSRSQNVPAQYDFRLIAASFGVRAPDLYSILEKAQNNRWLTASQIIAGGPLTARASEAVEVSETAERIMLRLLPGLVPARVEEPLAEATFTAEGTYRFQTVPLGPYSLTPIASGTKAYWLRDGIQPPQLVDWFTDQAVPEDRRGKPLSYFVKEFDNDHRGARLVAVLSFGDAAVNKNRAILLRDELFAVPCAISEFAQPLPWLVCYETGIIRAERLRVEAVVEGRLCRAVRATMEDSPNGKNLLPFLRWAILGIPVIADGRPIDGAVRRLDDDVRHWAVTPHKDGLYVLEKALLDAKGQGWDWMEPLEVCLDQYGDLPSTFESIFRAGYHQVFTAPKRSGEVQIVAPNRIAIRPLESGYGTSMIGLCKDGSLGTFMCKAPPTDRGYIAPSVQDQVRMMCGFFQHAWILDEGLDPVYFDLRLGIAPDEFPVRGRPGGRLSAAMCLFEATHP